jgi:hypothetical protein
MSEQWQRDIIAKVAKGIPLTISERDFAAHALRERWFTKKELSDFMRDAKHDQIEIAKRLAAMVTVRSDGTKKPVVKYGKREEWVRKVGGFRTKEALKQFVRRARRDRE